MARRTKEGAEETRANILKAALSLFSSQGVSGTTLTEVANKAGVTRGAIYWHFDNKDHLLQALWEQLILPYENITQLGERLDEPDPLGRLQEIYRTVLADLIEDTTTRQLFQIWMDRGNLGSADRNESDIEQSERRQRSLLRIENILRSAAAKGQLPASFDARTGALLLFTFMDGMVSALLLNPKNATAKQDVAQMIDALFFMLSEGNNPYLTTSPGTGNYA
jgi:TetR/AcrR family acrAB operon transcriptional repressor